MRPGKRPMFGVYRGIDGRWRWRVKASNGRTVADSGQGYVYKADAIRGARIVQEAAFIAPIQIGVEP